MTTQFARKSSTDQVEEYLIKAMLDGVYQPGSRLPSERDLARSLGVTRPTLREALNRLDRDGWLTIQHGKPTRINAFWVEGGLNVLNAIAQTGRDLPPGFVDCLLDVRVRLAPGYTAEAIRHDGQAVTDLLAESFDLENAEAFSNFDWRLHHQLTVLSKNPVYTMILNGFRDLYARMGVYYFQSEEARTASRHFYDTLHQHALNAEPERAEQLTHQTMVESRTFWRAVVGGVS